MIEVIKQGKPVPPNVWRQATDLLIEYRQAGEAWAAAGRPEGGPLALAHNRAEKAYNEAADAIWYGKWTDEQRAEWSRLWAESPYAAADEKMQRVMAGEAVVADDEWLDSVDLPSDVVSIPNPGRTGLRDVYLVGKVDNPTIHEWRVKNGIVDVEEPQRAKLKMAL